MVFACVGTSSAHPRKMPAHLQTLPTVVPEDFDEGAIKDSDSEADPIVAALEPDLAESWLRFRTDSDPEVALPEVATGASCQDCRHAKALSCCSGLTCAASQALLFATV